MTPKPYHGEVDAFTDKPAPAKKTCPCGEPLTEKDLYWCEGCRARWMPVSDD